MEGDKGSGQSTQKSPAKGQTQFEDSKSNTSPKPRTPKRDTQSPSSVTQEQRGVSPKRDVKKFARTAKPSAQTDQKELGAIKKSQTRSGLELSGTSSDKRSKSPKSPSDLRSRDPSREPFSSKRRFNQDNQGAIQKQDLKNKTENKENLYSVPKKKQDVVSDICGKRKTDCPKSPSARPIDKENMGPKREDAPKAKQEIKTTHGAISTGEPACRRKVNMQQTVAQGKMSIKEDTSSANRVKQGSPSKIGNGQIGASAKPGTPDNNLLDSVEMQNKCKTDISLGAARVHREKVRSIKSSKPIVNNQKQSEGKHLSQQTNTLSPNNALVSQGTPDLKARSRSQEPPKPTKQNEVTKSKSANTVSDVSISTDTSKDSEGEQLSQSYAERNTGTIEQPVLKTVLADVEENNLREGPIRLEKGAQDLNQINKDEKKMNIPPKSKLDISVEIPPTVLENSYQNLLLSNLLDSGDSNVKESNDKVLNTRTFTDTMIDPYKKESGRNPTSPGGMAASDVARTHGVIQKYSSKNQLNKPLEVPNKLSCDPRFIKEYPCQSMRREKKKMTIVHTAEGMKKVETPAQTPVDETTGCGGAQSTACPIYFGVRSYLHHFYDPPPPRSPLYEEEEIEEDDFEYLVDPDKRRAEARRNFWLRAGAWGGVNLALVGIIALLVGYLTPQRQMIVEYRDELEILDRWAIAFNRRLELCRLAGLAVFCCGGAVLLITLLMSTFLQNARCSCCNRYPYGNNMVEPFVAAHDDVEAGRIPITEKIKSVQPTVWPEITTINEGGLAVQLP